MLEALKEIKELIAIVISLIIGIFVLFKKLVNALKSKTRLKNQISLDAITLALISEAEKFTSYSGVEKKEWVKTKVNQYAITNNIIYDEGVVDGVIENLIDLSKKVNKRDKDKGMLL